MPRRQIQDPLAPFGFENFRLTPEEEESIKRRQVFGGGGGFGGGAGRTIVPQNAGTKGPLRDLPQDANPTDFTPQLEGIFPSFIGPIEEEKANPIPIEAGPRLVPSPVDTRGLMAQKAGIQPERQTSLPVTERLRRGLSSLGGQFKEELKNEGSRNLLLDITGAQLANIGSPTQDPNAPVRGIQGAVASQRARQAATAKNRQEIAIENFKEQGRRARTQETIRAQRDIAANREAGLQKRFDAEQQRLKASSEQSASAITGTDLTNSQKAIGAALGMDLESVGGKSISELLDSGRKKGVGAWETVAREVERQHPNVSIIQFSNDIAAFKGVGGSDKDKANVLIKSISPVSNQFRDGWFSPEAENAVREIAKGATQDQKIQLESITGLRLTPSRAQRGAETLIKSPIPQLGGSSIAGIGEGVQSGLERIGTAIQGLRSQRAQTQGPRG